MAEYRAREREQGGLAGHRTDTILADLIGFKPNPLAAYAEQLRDERSWSFWWD